MAFVIDGKKISAQIKDELKDKVSTLKADGKEICLAVIQVGNDPASTVYVGNKKKACEYIGIKSLAYELPEETTEQELIAIIDKLNADVQICLNGSCNNGACYIRTTAGECLDCIIRTDTIETRNYCSVYSKQSF